MRTDEATTPYVRALQAEGREFASVYLHALDAEPYVRYGDPLRRILAVYVRLLTFSQAAVAELEKLLVRAAAELPAPAGETPETGLEAVKALRARRRGLALEAVGAVARFTPRGDEVGKAERGRAKKAPEARIRLTDSLRPFKGVTRLSLTDKLARYASDGDELESRLRALARVAHELFMQEGRPVYLEAILIERDAQTHDNDLDLDELARVYGIPTGVIGEWLRNSPHPLEGLYDDEDSAPAPYRQSAGRDDAGEFHSLHAHGINTSPDKQDAFGFSVFRASGLDKGRPSAERDVSQIIEDATGFTLDHCLKLMRPGRPRKDTLADRYWLDAMLANIVARKEAAIVGLAETLKCDRGTVEARVIDGDFEPIPATGAPPEWQGEREVELRRVGVRWTAPQTCTSTPSEVAARIEADRQLERESQRLRRYSPERFPEHSGSTAIGWDSATVDEPSDDLDRPAEATTDDRGHLDAEADRLVGDELVYESEIANVAR